MHELKNSDITILYDDGELLENFADQYLADALRIIMTKSFTSLDNDLLYEAVCVLTSMYMKKVKNGEINQDRVMH